MSYEMLKQLALIYVQARASGHDVTPEQIKLWFDEAMDAYAYKPEPKVEKPDWDFALRD